LEINSRPLNFNESHTLFYISSKSDIQHINRSQTIILNDYRGLNLKCYTCNKKTNDYKRDVRICGSCREVLKVDLVNLVLELDPVYLSEQNRHKSGRKSKLTAEQKQDAKYRHLCGESFAAIAKDLGVCKTTIYNAAKRAY
jgi:hypothetical protein